MRERVDVRIHPTAEVSDEAEIGAGTRIWHQAQVRERAQIGQGCILGKGAYVDFDVVMGDNCKLQNGVYVYHPAKLGAGVFLGPGVIVTNDRRPRAVNPDLSLKSDADWVASESTIGEGAAVGAGSVLLPGVHIGAWAMVGAGSVVTKDVPAHALVYGNPARLAGYVCQCGTTLERQDENFHCPSCGRQLELERSEP